MRLFIKWQRLYWINWELPDVPEKQVYINIFKKIHGREKRL
jgi:hypothetical protein